MISKWYFKTTGLSSNIPDTFVESTLGYICTELSSLGFFSILLINMTTVLMLGFKKKIPQPCRIY